MKTQLRVKLPSRLAIFPGSEPKVCSRRKTTSSFLALTQTPEKRHHPRRRHAYPNLKDPQAVRALIPLQSRFQQCSRRRGTGPSHSSSSAARACRDATIRRGTLWANTSPPSQSRPRLPRSWSRRQAPQAPRWSRSGRWSAPPPHQHGQGSTTRETRGPGGSELICRGSTIRVTSARLECGTSTSSRTTSGSLSSTWTR